MNPARDNHVHRPTPAVCLLLAMMAFGMATYFFWHFYPGALSPDSIGMLTQARSGIWADASPPLMVGIWSLADRVIPGAAGMLALELLLYYGGLFLIFLPVAGRSPFAACVALPVAGMFPPLVGIIGAIWSDVLMAGLFLFGTGIFLATRNMARERRHALTAVALVFIAMGVLLRQNAAAGALGLVVGGVLIAQRNTMQWGRFNVPRLVVKSVGIGLATTVVIFLAGGQIFRLMVDVPKHFWRVAPIYDIAGTSYFAKSDLFAEGLFPGNSLENIDKLYSSRSVTPLLVGEQVHQAPGLPPRTGVAYSYAQLSARQDRILLRNWAEIISQHPGAYLQHRAAVFREVIERTSWGLWAPVFEFVYGNDLGISERPPRPSSYFEWIKQLAYDNKVFEPCWYLLISLILAAPVLIVGIRSGNSMFIAAGSLLSSGIFHMVGLFFFAASPDFRYSHWMIATTTIAILLLVCELLAGLTNNSRSVSPTQFKN